MFTIGRAVTRAQEILQDVDGVRYTPAQLTAYLTEGIVAIRRVRPDIFIGQYATALSDYTESDLDSALPVPDSLLQGLAEYVAGRAELRDDEFAVDGRAMTMREQLNKVLLQGV